MPHAHFASSSLGEWDRHSKRGNSPETLPGSVRVAARTNCRIAQAGISRAGYDAVSHETIYRVCSFTPGRAQESIAGHAASLAGQLGWQIIDGVFIRDRPAHLKDRA